MNNTLIYFFVAIGLSMDAFSLALVYGVNNLKYKKIFLLSIIVGIFHFIMPLIGGKIGGIFQDKLIIGSNIIVGIVFLIISIEMIISLKDSEKEMVLDKLIYLILFGFTVSIDSLSVGIAYGISKEDMYLSSTIFSLISSMFTFLGLVIGSIFGRKFQKQSKLIGAILLIFLAIKYIFD